MCQCCLYFPLFKFSKWIRIKLRELHAWSPSQLSCGQKKVGPMETVDSEVCELFRKEIYKRDMLLLNSLMVNGLHLYSATLRDKALSNFHTDVIFQSCEHHKQNPIHLHCTGVSSDTETGLIQIKTKLSPLIEITRGKGENRFFMVWVYQSFKLEFNYYRTCHLSRLKRLLYYCLLPSQFIFVWVHVTEEDKTGDISFNKNIQITTALQTGSRHKGSLCSEGLFFCLFNISWCKINCGSCLNLLKWEAINSAKKHKLNN